MKQGDKVKLNTGEVGVVESVFLATSGRVGFFSPDKMVRVKVQSNAGFEIKSFKENELELIKNGNEEVR